MFGVIFRDDEYYLSDISGSLKLSKKGVYTATDVVYGEFHSKKWHEIVRDDGTVLQTLKWGDLCVDKGAKFTVRPCAPPKIDYTSEEISAARQTMTITIVDQERYDDGPFSFGASYEDGTLDDVIESLAKIRELIPAKYRKKARCEIDSVSGYEGSHSAEIKVSYMRPETDEEVVARLQDRAIEAMIKERVERANLAALQAKYEKAEAGL